MSGPREPCEELLDALRAVREALDIPHPATVADGETHDRILKERILHTVVMLGNIFPDNGRPCAPDTIPWSVEYLRARLAEHPASGYRTWAEHVAELKSGPARTCTDWDCPDPVHQEPADEADDDADDGRDYAEEAYNRDFCDACGSSPCTWYGAPDGFHTDDETDGAR